jgi:hypothetical protein
MTGTDRAASGSARSAGGQSPGRGQTELPELAVAFVVLTAVVTFGVGAATTALSGADRDAVERQQAVSVSERLVSADAPVTARANVLAADALGKLNAAVLRRVYGLSADSDVRVTLDDEVLVADGDPAGGTTTERLVVVENRTAAVVETDFEGNRTAVLPRRSPRVRLRIDPDDGTTVRTVRANDRVVLHNASGLRGQFEVSLSRYDTKRLTFEAIGRFDDQDVEIVHFPATTRKARLVVTVDA